MDRIDKIYKIISQYEKEKIDIDVLTRFTLNAVIQSKTEDKNLIEIAVKILFKSDIDFMVGSPSRTKEYVTMRRVYIAIRYLFLKEKVQVVADEMSMTRANLYHHCEVMFNHHDYDTEYRNFIMMLFDKKTFEEMRKRFNRIKKR